MWVSLADSLWKVSVRGGKGEGRGREGGGKGEGRGREGGGKGEGRGGKGEGRGREGGGKGDGRMEGGWRRETKPELHVGPVQLVSHWHTPVSHLPCTHTTFAHGSGNTRVILKEEGERAK